MFIYVYFVQQKPYSGIILDKTHTSGGEHSNLTTSFHHFCCELTTMVWKSTAPTIRGEFAGVRILVFQGYDLHGEFPPIADLSFLRLIILHVNYRWRDELTNTPNHEFTLVGYA